MSDNKVNLHGVPIGPNGYVYCQTCGKEVREISREVSKEYALCLCHRVPTTKEVAMPPAPKPSQKSEVVQQKQPKKQPKKQSHRTQVYIPAHGPMGNLLTWAKSQTGLTHQLLQQECTTRKMEHTYKRARYYCEKLKLLA